MRTAIYNTFSPKIEEVAKLTQPNHAQYARRHGYEYISEGRGEDESHQMGLSRVLQLLDSFDVVLLIGSDVLFMNHRIRIALNANQLTLNFTNPVGNGKNQKITLARIVILEKIQTAMGIVLCVLVRFGINNKLRIVLVGWMTLFWFVASTPWCFLPT